MSATVYREIPLDRGFVAVFAGLLVFCLIGLASAWTMEHNGHVVTGMTNQIVWGVPHVAAVFLIVAASGALNVASLGSVFGKSAYKPMARLSGLLAIALLGGGLAILVLDLGRPDRIIVAMTSYNFRSIFAWNIFLYTGFFIVVGAYLFVHMARGFDAYVRPVGWFAFIWRLVLTTGTGSIFGWLVARQAYDAAVMAPLFIALSLSLGMAVFLLVTVLICHFSGRELGHNMLRRQARLLGIFVGCVLYFTAVQHLTNLYASEHHGVERFLLAYGCIYTGLFWGVQVVLGGLVPLAIVFLPWFGAGRAPVIAAALLVLIGGLAQIYVIIIGGQAYPLVLFPGMEVTSTFYDGKVADYVPSLPEIGLGLGGTAMALIIAWIGVKVLKIMPVSLSDAVVDPHHRSG
jgi:molybdopterin-containing oxidoreductase family membrane subunit